MLRRVCLVALTAALAAGSSCPPNQGGGGGGGGSNTLVPRPWPQVYEDKENSGFNAVHSPPAATTLRKWSAPVGPIAFASPVIGPDGTIYVANASGEIVGLNPQGQQLFRRKIAPSFLSSPAINTQNEELVILGQEPSGTPGTLASRLYRLEPGGSLLNASTEVINTSAAPKIWQNTVFVASATTLYAFDQTSLNLIGNVNTLPCFNLTCGSFEPPGWLQGIITFFDCIVNGAADCVGSVPVPAGPVLQPSVAIVDASNLVQDPNLPTIITVGPQCCTAFRFHPAGDAPTLAIPQDPHFETLWSHALVPADCDHFNATVRGTTPAAILGGLVVFSYTSDGASSTVLALDLLTGDEVWHNQFNVIQAPVVAALRQIYAATNAYLLVLDSNGAVVGTSTMQGTGENAAIGLDFVYATSDQGVHSYAIPVSQFSDFFFSPTRVDGSGTGTSYPVIGEDGTVYVTSPDGVLFAYQQGTTPFVAAAAFPGVTWGSPTDGATLPSAPGQVLVVNLAGVSGVAFNGLVSFVSDVDGPLCSNVPAGPTARCVTTKALTIGTQHLTAFANDTNGPSSSARITVQVANTPPSVTITSPADNAAFAPGASITFTATVNDPDQPTFPPDHVQWTSSLQGNIGTGLSFTRKLSVGTHTITATATDAAGVTGTATVTVHVTSNPVVTIEQPADGAILFSGTPITFSATVADPSEPSFPASGIRWSSSIDGDLGTGASVSHALSNGDHTITCTATNTHNGTGQATIHVTVQPPIQ